MTEIDIDNITETIQNDVCSALNDALDEILDKLKEYIQNTLYDAYNPSWYERTNEVLSNWEETKAQLKGNIFEASFDFTAPISHSGYPFYQHGISPIDNETLLDILTGQAQWGSAIRGSFPKARDFWTPFTQWFDANADAIIAKHLKAKGL